MTCTEGWYAGAEKVPRETISAILYSKAKINYLLGMESIKMKKGLLATFSNCVKGSYEKKNKQNNTNRTNQIHWKGV